MTYTVAFNADPSQVRSETFPWQSLLLQNQQAGTVLGHGLGWQGSIGPPGAGYQSVQPGAYPSFGIDQRLGFQQQWMGANFSGAGTAMGLGGSQFQDLPNSARIGSAVTSTNVQGSHLPVASSTAAASQGTGQPGQLDPGSRTLRTQSDSMGRSSLILYIPSCDDEALSEYQCVVRKQIELFEASREDAESNAQGRNRPIVMGQVGIRCIHCTFLPPKHRARGATYYPAKLEGLYQAAQNMASGHLCEYCPHVPDAIRRELLKLRERKSSAGGGKKYWADGIKVLGVHEAEGCLRFKRG